MYRFLSGEAHTLVSPSTGHTKAATRLSDRKFHEVLRRKIAPEQAIFFSALTSLIYIRLGTLIARENCVLQQRAFALGLPLAAVKKASVRPSDGKSLLFLPLMPNSV
jgi:hypothetical protein